MSNRSLQRNAADPQQVRYAARKERQREVLFSDCLRAVMRTPEGRLVMWELLTRAGIYRSVWDPSAKIHYNAGRQDYGHELLATLLETDAEAYLEMEREMRSRDQRDAREAAAMQATEGGGNDRSS